MAFNLYASASLRSLSRELARKLTLSETSVFQPYYLVTQTQGMNNWIRIRLAEELEIAANIQFFKPNEFITKAYHLLGGKFRDQLNSDNLTWLLYTILDEPEFIARFPGTGNYFEGTGGQADLKRMALAEKLSDLFDQYQIYRPEMIQEWNTSNPGSVSAGDWQKYLWIKARALSRERLPDKTGIGDYIVAALTDPAKRQMIRSRMPDIHIFGLSITTSFHMGILMSLASCLEINFYILNPAPSEYWFEDRSEKQLALWARNGLSTEYLSSGNTLLSSWGRIIQDTFSLLFKQEELLNTYEEVYVAAPSPATLLGKIQNEIHHNVGRHERSPVSQEELLDNSLVINSCHTLIREVEVLYNYLVALVDQRQEKLSARDIVVMATDIDAYSPFIKAVFDHAPYRFNYSIADESYSGGDTVVLALMSLFDLEENSFSSENVFSILDSSFIRSRFKLADLPFLRKMVSLAGVRFGTTGQTGNETRYVSWDYGLNRVLYGSCLGNESLYENQGAPVFPLDLVEGNDLYEAVRFSHFIRVLMQALQEREAGRTLDKWIDYVHSILQNFILDTDDEADEEYLLIEQQLGRMAQASEFSNAEISFDVFRHHLRRVLSGVTRAASFAVRGLTFCSLIPMRSIPFKVVAVLGMDYDKFPRKENPAAFDLMQENKRAGDRNVRENDKHLFLETLLSAQNYLYLSYNGQSAKENSTLPPSALIDELLDYIQDQCSEDDIARRSLICNQPLQSFSRKYNQSNDSRYYSYLLSKKPGTLPFTHPGIPKTLTEVATETVLQLDLEELISFYKNPLKAFYKTKLGIIYEREASLLEETELFELDKLQEWQLKNDLLGLDETAIELFRLKKVRTGAFPLGNIGKLEINKVRETVSQVRQQLNELDIQTEPVPLELFLTLPGFEISGALRLHDRKLIIVSWSSDDSKYALEAGIKYLLLRAAGKEVDVYLVSAKLEKTFKSVAVTCDQAHAHLLELLAFYKNGLSIQPAYHPKIKFHPEKYRKAPKEGKEQDPVELFQKVLRGKLEGYNSHRRSANPYLANAWEMGFYESEQALADYESQSLLIYELLDELFPEYFKLFLNQK